MRTAHPTFKLFTCYSESESCIRHMRKIAYMKTVTEATKEYCIRATVWFCLVWFGCAQCHTHTHTENDDFFLQHHNIIHSDTPNRGTLTSAYCTFSVQTTQSSLWWSIQVCFFHLWFFLLLFAQNDLFVYFCGCHDFNLKMVKSVFSTGQRECERLAQKSFHSLIKNYQNEPNCYFGRKKLTG